MNFHLQTQTADQTVHPLHLENLLWILSTNSDEGGLDS